MPRVPPYLSGLRDAGHPPCVSLLAPTSLFCYPCAWLSCLGRAAVPASLAFLARTAACCTSSRFESSILHGWRVIPTPHPWACADPHPPAGIGMAMPPNFAVRATLYCVARAFMVRASVQARAVRPCSFATSLGAACLSCPCRSLSSLLLVSYTAPWLPKRAYAFARDPGLAWCVGRQQRMRSWVRC
mgnify:CR=1 FL=1